MHFLHDVLCSVCIVVVHMVNVVACVGITYINKITFVKIT